MNKPLIKLEEIIYEITGKCNNGCSYCGSKDQWKCEIDTAKIDKIVDQIADYPPTAIDISGGDPLLVPLATHQRLVSKLKQKGVNVKILFNPKSFKTGMPMDKYDILKLYEWIGVSINEKDELEGFNTIFDKNPYNLRDKMTVITNFNVSNVFMFTHIQKLVQKYNMIWQIQYTTYQNPEDTTAIYNNEEALDYLFDKITNALDSNVKIVLADDMTSGQCGAGISSIGILSNGDVIPCLSMRSWVKHLGDVYVGNLLHTPLSFIWETGFIEQRFRGCKCCKDHCKNKEYVKPQSKQPTLPIWPPEPLKYETVVNTVCGKVYLYGVTPKYIKPNITVYSVFSGDITQTGTYTGNSKAMCRYGVSKGFKNAYDNPNEGIDFSKIT